LPLPGTVFFRIVEGEFSEDIPVVGEDFFFYNSNFMAPFSFSDKASAHNEAKDYIGKLAAAQVQEGEVIFMDCGSTVFRMCTYLKEKRITVVTNSLPVVLKLINTAVSINLVGGELDPARQAVHGRMAEEHISRYQADRAFVGAGGVSVARGLSAGSELEAGITLAMVTNARHAYLLCDESKLEQDRYLSFAPLGIINTLITNTEPEKLTEYGELGVGVIC
jgi:DeoR family transcriptional regulator, fructose operon transcriptional repressor